MDSSAKLVRLFLISFFVFPVLWLLFHLDKYATLSFSELTKYTMQSLVQASLSTVIIALMGAVFCMGLIAVRNKKFWMSLSVLPAFAPTVFIVISFQMWIDRFSFENTEGLLLVSLVHGVMNLGLAGTLFYTVVESGLASQANLAYLEGSSRLKIIVHLFRAKKKEILLILVSFFALCFTSFAIPMILGGKNGGTLEILAYTRLSQFGDLTGAFLISLFQWLIFFILIKPLSGVLTFTQNSYEKPPTAIGIDWCKWVGLFALVISFGGMLFGLNTGWAQLELLMSTGFGLFPLWLNSILISVASALASFIIFMTMAYLWTDLVLHRFVIGFGSVSSVLLGLGFYSMNLPALFKLSLGLCILFFPLAYRTFGAPSLLSLGQQSEVAKLCGAKRSKVFLDIVYPQVLPSALKLSGVVAFWVIGEYAFSSVVTGELWNLALLAKSFMTGYRLELATILNWIILLSGGLIFGIFFWSADVCSRKLKL